MDSMVRLVQTTLYGAELGVKATVAALKLLKRFLIFNATIAQKMMDKNAGRTSMKKLKKKSAIQEFQKMDSIETYKEFEKIAKKRGILFVPIKTKDGSVYIAYRQEDAPAVLNAIKTIGEDRAYKESRRQKKQERRAAKKNKDGDQTVFDDFMEKNKTVNMEEFMNASGFMNMTDKEFEEAMKEQFGDAYEKGMEELKNMDNPELKDFFTKTEEQIKEMVAESRREGSYEKRVEKGAEMVDIKKEDVIDQNPETEQIKIVLHDKEGKSQPAWVNAGDLKINRDKHNEVQNLQLCVDEQTKIRLTASVEDSGNRKDITIDRDSLVISETGRSVKTYVPGTKRQTYINLDASKIKDINDGKTILYALDRNKRYTVYENGQKKTMSGDKLCSYFDDAEIYNRIDEKLTVSGKDILKYTQKSDMAKEDTVRSMSKDISNIIAENKSRQQKQHTGARKK